jgi:Zn-dependent alcohol dehydrogenase
MKITAAVMHEQGLPQPFAQSQPFRIERVDLEGPGPEEVLVEVRAAGLCHSDLSQVKGLRKRQLPVVGGHEAAGIVREVGAHVQGFGPGDHVVMTVVAGCGNCSYCRRGRPALCDRVTGPRTKGLLSNGARKLSLNGAPVYHYSGVSGFAEYAVVMPGSLVKIDPAVPLDIAAMYGCAVITGAGAVFNTARLPAGSTVAVLGLGGIGLNGIMAAKLAGASQIIGVDLLEDKFDLALQLGATAVVKAGAPDAIEQVRALSDGGVDFAFEMSGAKPAMASTIAMLRSGGEAICVGLGASDDLHQYNHVALVTQEKSIRGCFMGSCQPQRDIPQYISLYLDGKMPVDALRSEQIGFDRLNESFDRLAAGQVIRQILLPHGRL